VLGAVRARHNELVKIEDSIRELAGLFQDLDTLVIQQEPTIIRAEEQTEQTNVHLDQGTQQVAQATKSAKRARRLKWWCALVVVLIVIAIALGVGLGVALTRNATKTS
jgi:syntaxin 1B/2/3